MVFLTKEVKPLLVRSFSIRSDIDSNWFFSILNTSVGTFFVISWAFPLPVLSSHFKHSSLNELISVNVLCFAKLYFANFTTASILPLLCRALHSKGKIENHYRAKTKVNLIRYADDFIITANSKEVAEELKTIVSQFLQSRGLSLSEEKTMITHIDKGFDFLGWTFKKYKGKLIVKPSKSSIKILVKKCSKIILEEGKAIKQSDLIRRLNQVIRGWTNYHKHVVASKVFSYINNTLYYLLQQW